MRAILATAAMLGSLSLVADAPASTLASVRAPTQAQIRAAVRDAERSRQLWATVNICHTPKFGIRGQMPALGFPTTMSMQIQVSYWNPAKKRYVPDRGAVETVSLGRVAHNLHQGGFVWQFQQSVILSGSVTFRWRLGRRVIGKTTRPTANGIKHVDDTDPKGNSTAACKLRATSATRGTGERS